MKMEPVKSFVAEADEPLRRLSHALRHPETWPDDFGEWDFHIPNKCAMGLACKLGMADKPYGTAMMAAFDISYSTVVDIFHRGYIDPKYGTTTPTEIADRIDASLARQPA
jgi:hypothetical protein